VYTLLSIIPELGKQKQEVWFKVSIGYIKRACEKKRKREKERERERGERKRRRKGGKGKRKKKTPGSVK
jgi:hypothetical protein